MPTKRKWNNDGAISIFSILIIVLLLITGWQLIAPSFNIASPYTLLTGDTDTNPTYEFSIRDLVTNEQIPLTNNGNTTKEYELGHVYKLQLNTNAQYHYFIAPYRIIIRNVPVLYEDFAVHDYIATDIVIQATSDHLPYSYIFSNTGQFTLTTYLNISELNPTFFTEVINWFTIDFYNPDGLLLFHSTFWLYREVV